MKITTSFFKVMVLLALFTIHCSLFTQAGNLANYEVVPLPQHIDLQKGEPFVLSNQVQILAGEGLQREVKEAEGYILTVSQKGIRIEGGSAAGVFYGIQTLRKAVKEGSVLPAVIITDAPRFVWRGMHLDCSRHFFSTDFVKKFIDLLALHNMNRFHWHLTDDQGWRIEMKKWPKLASDRRPRLAY